MVGKSILMSREALDDHLLSYATLASLPEEERRAAIDATLVKREGSPENIAQAVLFLVDNDFVTGVCLPVDGGRTIFAPDSVT